MSQSLRLIDSYNPSLPPTEDDQSIESASYGRIGLHDHRKNKIKIYALLSILTTRQKSTRYWTTEVITTAIAFLLTLSAQLGTVVISLPRGCPA